MESRPVSLMELFNGEGQQCVVPLFQRPYTWKAKDWGLLWDDLLDCYRAAASGKPAPPHFLGAVVTTPVSSVPAGVNKHLVIDGQQRLTTLSLLLLALRDRAKTDGSPGVAGKSQRHLINEYEDGVDRLKLRPTDEDLGPYRRLIDADESVHQDEPNSQIVKAYAFFAKEFDRVADETGQPESLDLQRLFDAVRSGMQVVLIALGSDDDPYVIFETLNNRGQSLTEADLVRNTVLMRFEHGTGPDSPQRQAYADYWKPIERNICGDRTAAEAASDLSEFFRHSTMMDGSQTGLSGIYMAVKRTLDPLNANDLVGQLKRIRDLSKIYGSLLRPEEADESIRSSLQSIREMKLTLSYPLLMRLVDDYRQGRLDENELSECVRSVESFLLRRVVCDVPSNQLKRLFGRFCRSLPSESQPPGATLALLRRLMSEGTRGARWPNDLEFREAIQSEPLYSSKKFRVRVLLTGLEAAYEHKEAADPSRATIEHLFPQTPGDDWKKSLSQSDFEQAIELRDCLGNLTLSAYNSELGNKSWDDKLVILAESNFDLNKSLSQAATWDASRIRERGADLAVRCSELWPGPNDEAA